MAINEVFEAEKRREKEIEARVNYEIAKYSVSGACAAVSVLNLINGNLETATLFATAGILSYAAFKKFQPFPGA